jgi:hypothetical protein
MDETLDSWMFEEHEKKRLKFYKDFISVEEAKDFIKLLNVHDIPYSVDVPETIIDQTIVGTGLLPKAIIKLLPEDFKKVNTILENQLAGAVYADVKDHYLNQFEDQELQEIFEKPDEWSLEDAIVAKIILRERGLTITDERVQQLREARMQEIRKGKAGNKIMMLFYFLSIFLIVFVHPIFFLAGAGMGYYYAYGRDVDPDGQKHYSFEPKTRIYGKVLLYGGIVVLLIELVLLSSLF